MTVLALRRLALWLGFTHRRPTPAEPAWRACPNNSPVWLSDGDLVRCIAFGVRDTSNPDTPVTLTLAEWSYLPDERKP